MPCKRSKAFKGSVTLDKSSHDTSSSLDTQGKRGNIKKKILSLLRGVAGEDDSLDYSTIGDSLIRVDPLVGLLAIEEVGDEFDHTRNISGTINQDNFADIRLVNLGVLEYPLDRVKSAMERSSHIIVTALH